MLAARGVTAPPAGRSLPFGLAWRIAGLAEAAWRRFGLAGDPPITRQVLRLIGQDFTVSIAAARRDLGYDPPLGRAAALRGLAAP
jgi:hypothetical protein